MNATIRRTASKAVSATLALLLLSGGAAHAQGDRMKEVKRACAAGEVDRGVRLLADIYTETNDPIAIYNQGRCYQQNAKPELAASRFREYLRKERNLPPRERAEVEGFIREADAEAGRRVAAPANVAPAYAPPAAGYPPAQTGYPVTPAGGYPPATTPGGYAGPARAAPPGYPPAGGYPAQSYPPGAYPPAPLAPVTVAGKSAPVRRKKGLLIAGTITFGASYLLTALVGAGLMSDDPARDPAVTCTNCTRPGRLMLIPVLGPWLAMPDLATELRSGVALLGVGQAAGLTLSILGYRSYSNSGKPTPKVAGLGHLQLGFAPAPGGGFGSLRAKF